MNVRSAALANPPESLEARLAQLLMVRIGSNMPPIVAAGEDERRVAQLLETCPVGGLIVFHGGTAAGPTLERLQRASRVPLLVGADIERGVGQQVSGHTLFPHAMAFERLGTEAAAAVAQFAQVLAREAREVGIHITFGPVADVNTNPRNPIIATRAFSGEADRAAELCAAYVRACEAAGLCTTAKHFLGHGDTHQDSHDSLPTVPRSLAELEACELVPFKAAIDAGCSLVMTAHVAYPQIERSGLPATLSPTILQGLLRERLGFDGVICSDSLLMAGVRDRFPSEAEMARAALAAGVDLLLDVVEPAEVVQQLVASVEAGRLDRQRVDEAFERVWALKRRVADSSADDSLRPAAAGVDAEELAERVAGGAVQLVGRITGGMLPFDPAKPLAAILLKPFATPFDPPEQPLAGALRERLADVRYVELGPDATGEMFESAEQLALAAEQLLVAMIVKPAAWRAFGLLPEQRALVERLVGERPAMLASLGVPYALDDYPDAAARICTFSDVPVSQRALADFLLSGARGT